MMKRHSQQEGKSEQEEERLLSRNSRENGSWFTALRSSWQAAWQFNHSQFTSFQAIRCTLGFALPLAVGVAIGQIPAGLVIASGSFTLGLVGLQDPYRTRVQTMALASLFVVLSTLVGGITGSAGWLFVLVTGIWGVVAGMIASVGPVGLALGLQACGALIVFAHFAPTPVQALQITALVGIGVLFQTLLAIIPSPWTNTALERAALAAIYQKLAEYAANVFSKQDVLQLADILLQGHTTLAYSNTHTEQGKLFARLLEEAERLRLTLTILASSSRRLTKGQLQERSASDHLGRIMHSSADELRSIAQALHPSRCFIQASSSRPEETIHQYLAELRKLAQTSANQEELRPLLSSCTALLSELHMAGRLARVWRDARQGWSLRIHFSSPRSPHLHLENTWTNMCANLTLQSSSFRHALRLGIALALATALHLVFPPLAEHSYWIPLTVVLVLRSDFITTFTRSIARLLGTMLGAVLTTLLIVVLTPSQPMLVAIIPIAVYLMYSTLFANYAIFSAAITMAIVLLLSFTTTQTVMAAAYRALDTAIGGTLALLIYALWPTWEQSQVPENIARRFEALGHYVKAVIQLEANPDEQQIHTLDRLHLSSRLARSNALGSVRRSLQEPKTNRIDAELAEALLGAADNIARSTLTLEAYFRDTPQHYALLEMAILGKQIDEAMSRLAAALRESHQATGLPDLPIALRKLQAAIKEKKQTPDEARSQWHFQIGEAKRIIANIQATQQLLLTRAASR